MQTLENTQTLPLRLSEDGTIRVGDSRVSLESVLHHYKLGATAEQIAQKFPALDLSDVYAAISYYLSKDEIVEEYLREQEAKGTHIQDKIEAGSGGQKQYAKFRARLLTRKSEAKRR